MKEKDYITVRNLTNISRALDAMRDTMIDDIITEDERQKVISTLAKLQDNIFKKINNKVRV